MNKILKVEELETYFGESIKQTKQLKDIKIDSKTLMCHTFKSKILNGSSPDFCLMDINRDLNKYSIKAPIEIKKSGLIDTNSQGQLLAYCLLIFVYLTYGCVGLLIGLACLAYLTIFYCSSLTRNSLTSFLGISNFINSLMYFEHILH